MNKIYLAIPYTWNPAVSELIANHVAAELMQKNVVFSPISHSHSIADHMHPELRISQEFWMAQDIPFVEWADEIVVIVIGERGNELIEHSKGVQTELAEARKLNKPIRYLPYKFVHPAIDSYLKSKGL